MVLVMVEFAKNILNKNAATLTSEEKSFVQFLLALSNHQRMAAADTAQANFKKWELKEIEKRTSEGLAALIDPLVEPPPEILAMAKAGYVVTGETVDNYMNVLAACSVPIAAGIGAGAAGVIVAGGGAATVAGAINPTIGAAIGIIQRAGGEKVIASILSRALPTISGLGAGIAVASLMIQAAIMKGIDVVKYEEYKAALNQAIADSRVPLTQEQLRALLDTWEGMQALALRLTAQSATGTTY